MTKTSVVLVALALAGALAARPCFAGDATAEALFRAGREALEKGDTATACSRFEESNRLEPAVGTVFNLANCYERQGRIASAWQRYRETKDRLPPNDERLPLVEQRIAALEPRLPRLTLSFAAPPEQATVERDGVAVGRASFGLPIPVDPGHHVVVVKVFDRLDKTLAVDLGEGEQRELALSVGEPVAAAPSPAEPAPASGSSQRTLGFVIGGVGVAGIATSLITGALVIDRKSTVDKECPNKQCTQAGLDAADSGRTLSTVSTIAFAAGAVGVGVGAYLIFSAHGGRESARLELSASPGRTTLRLGGHF